MYEQLSAQLSRPNKITFTKVNVDNQTEIASTYGITAYVFPVQHIAGQVDGVDSPRYIYEASANTTLTACQLS